MSARKIINNNINVRNKGSEKIEISRLMQVAHLAGFLKLQGSDLVYNAGQDNVAPTYYDCVISSKWNDFGLSSYIAVLDDKTNISDIRDFKIPAKMLSGYDALPVSDLTVAALALYVWRSVVGKRRVLILIGDWLSSAEESTKSMSPILNFEQQQKEKNDDMTPLECLKKIAKLYDVQFHVEQFKPTTDGSVEKFTLAGGAPQNGGKSAFMLRLLMCSNQPLSTPITEKVLRDFHALTTTTNRLKMCLLQQCFMYNYLSL